MDFFDFFRYALGTVVTIYATIITLQSLWGWYLWLAGQDRYISLVRRYVIVHGLRLRVRAFGGDVLVCLLLTIAFFILWRGHVRIYDLEDQRHALRARPSPYDRELIAPSTAAAHGIRPR